MSRLFNRFKFNSSSFNNFTSSRKFSSIDETLLSNRGDPNFKYKAGFLALMPICSLYLGIWQIKRLKWKEDLIQKVEEKRAHDPILLPSTLTPELYDELEYRPVIIRGKYLCDREILVGLRNHEGKSGYVVYTPFKREDTDQIILVRRGWVEKSMKNLVKRNDEVVTIRGQVRKGEVPNSYTPPNSPKAGQWFYVNIEEMAEFVGSEPVLVDAIAEHSPSLNNRLIQQGVPIGRSDEVSFYNHHAQYAFTWLSLSVVTSIMLYQFIKRKPNLPDFKKNRKIKF